MGADLFIERIEIGLALGLLMLGAVTAFVSGNVVKRLVGLLLANLGALLGLAALNAASALLLSAIAAAAATLIVGAALVVRLQEAYGGVEAPEFDAADEQSEPAEHGN
jgi:thiol:disulfide interchange protein